jgi:hypothetical protein
VKGEGFTVQGKGVTVYGKGHEVYFISSGSGGNNERMVYDFVLCWCRVQACTTGENIRLRVEGLDFYRRWGLEWQVTRYGFRVKGNG